jgi:hypothetical protein
MDDIMLRISRIYAAIDAIEECDPKKMVAKVIQNDVIIGVVQDFRGGLSDDQLSNQAHSVIHNIANLRDNLRRWAANNGHDKDRVDTLIENSIENRILQDLSNNDKHGYPPRGGGHSKKSPLLTKLTRVMRLQTQAKEGSMIGMTIGTNGVPRFFGDGTAKAVVTGDVVDNEGEYVGDLYEIVTKAVEIWERQLSDWGLITSKSGNNSP